jgi:CRP-like cAMP-binding protein
LRTQGSGSGDNLRDDMHSTRSSATRHQNQLLAALPGPERDRLMAEAMTRLVEPGDVLYEPGQPVVSVYFPLTTVVSVLTTLHDGTAVETATIGREGLVGTFVHLGDGTSPNARALVQMGGELVAVDARRFRHELRETGRLRDLMDEYTRALLIHVSQSVACSAAHNVRQRLSRWLLQTSDRVSSDDIRLTHEFLAGMLHTRRASVTVALRELQDLCLVRTRRGATLIVDRDALKEEACECYQLVRREYARLLPGEPDRATVATLGANGSSGEARREEEA